MYTVIIGLSWWIKAQSIERDTNAWTALQDVAWVIEEMIRSMSCPAKTKKHALEDKEKEGHVKKNVSSYL